MAAEHVHMDGMQRQPWRREEVGARATRPRLWLWHDQREPSGAHAGPESCRISIVIDGAAGRGVVAVEDASVPVLPEPLGCEDGNGGDPASKAVLRGGDGRGQPDNELIVLARDHGGGAAPRHHLGPYLAGEGVAGEKVLDGLGLLVEEETERRVPQDPMG